MIEDGQVRFLSNVQDINTRMAHLANLLRWGFGPSVLIPVEEPVSRDDLPDYLKQHGETHGIKFDNWHLNYDGNVYHPWHDPVQAVETVDDGASVEIQRAHDRRLDAVASEVVIDWFELTNDNHHIYKIFLDHRVGKPSILVTIAEIIDDSYNPAAKCECNPMFLESDVDTDFDSLNSLLGSDEDDNAVE